MKAVLFIHGFTAKKEDNKYFIEYLKKFKNITVFYFTLPGHENDTVSYVSYHEWLKESEKQFLEIKKNYKKVILIGHSMGAIIATYLASKYEIHKLVLLSPAYLFGSFEQNKQDLKQIIKMKEQKIETGFEGFFQKMKDVPVKSMVEYHKLSHIGRKDLEKITCPVLVMHGDKDNVISIKSSIFVLEKLNTKKEFVLIKDVRHQIFKSDKKEQISKYIYHYICGGLIYIINKRKEI